MFRNYHSMTNYKIDKKEVLNFNKFTELPYKKY